MAAIILAGGEGRRLGESKPLVKFQGKPLINHVLKVAMEVAEEIIIVAGIGNSKALRGLIPEGVRLLEDLKGGFGPLMGIYTGLKAVRNPFTLILPCDAPLLNVDVLRCLLEAVEGYDAAVPRWPNGYLEPLHAAYRVKTALKAAEKTMEEGRLEVRGLLERLDRVLYISTEDLRRLDPGLHTFHNINTPEELERAEEILAVR